MFHLGIVIALIVGVVVVRELARAVLQPERYVLRSMFSLRTPGSYARRTLTIAGALVGTYLAVAAIAVAHFQLHGTTGVFRYGVGEVLADGASAGVLEKGDRIDAVDGQRLVIGTPPTLVDVVAARRGAAVELAIVRGGVPRVVQVTPKPATDKQGRAVFLLGVRPVPVGEPTSEASVRRGFALPFVTMKYVARDAVGWVVGSEDPEVRGVVRITEEFKRAFDADERVLEVAAYYGSLLFLLACGLDLVRLLVVIRDKLRA